MSSPSSPVLSSAPAEVMRVLREETRFSREELEAMYEQFCVESNGTGRIDKDTFVEGLSRMGVSEVLAEQNFRVFDENGDGFVDFREFCVGMSALQRGTLDETLDFAFRVYDLDGDGFVEKDELKKILMASTAGSDAHHRKEELHFDSIVDEMFDRVDTNGDGMIDFQEFKDAVMNQKIVLSCMGL